MSNEVKTQCGHELPFADQRMCSHLLADTDLGFYRYFVVDESGDDLGEFILTCTACAAVNQADLRKLIVPVCMKCFNQVDLHRPYLGNVRRPDELVQETDLHFEHRCVSKWHSVPLLCITTGAATADWIALDKDLTLIRWNFETNERASFTELRDELLELKSETDFRLQVSSDARFVAVVQGSGSLGLIFDLLERRITMRLFRGTYRIENTQFPVAFFEHQGRTHLIHATDWNRVDVSLPATGELLTNRTMPVAETKGETPKHSLDYFFGTLAVSPNARHVASDGWFWGPSGSVKTWDLQSWLGQNTWESEDDRQYLNGIGYFWECGICFASDDLLVAWGIGSDSYWIAPGVRVYNMHTTQTREIFGPDLRIRGESVLHQPTLVADHYLYAFAFGTGISVWDVETGARVALDTTFCPIAYQPQTKTFINVADGNIQLSRLVNSVGGP
jgi:hypothetical protein